MKKIKEKNTIVVILSALIICLMFFGIYSYVRYIKIKNSKDSYEVLDVNSAQVKELFYLTRGNHITTLFYDTNYYNIYYDRDVVKMSELNEDFKKLLAYYTMDASLKDTSNNNTVFSATDLKKQYITVFGDDTNYIDEDIYCNCPSNIIYLPADHEYVRDGAYGTMILEGYNNKIIESRKYKDKIEIYEKVAFYREDENTGSISYYRDSTFKEKITEISRNKQFKFDEYQKQYDTYKYTFKLENASYYFDSVERIK